MANQVKVAKSRGISAVWVIPILALALAAWLIYEDQKSKGLLVTIQFSSADGLVPGQTKVKLKNVDIGTVESVTLDDDLDKVWVKARLQQSVEKFIDENTKFWVEKARIDMSGVSGLGTLLSGAFIGVSADGERGKSQSQFVGLETQPLASESREGSKVKLRAERVDGLTVGAPVFYRSVKVGTVDKVGLSEDLDYIEVGAYIFAPYNKIITESSVFWRVSGVEANISAAGIDFALNSLQSLITGAIAFETDPVHKNEGSTEDYYILYKTYEDTAERKVYAKEYFVLYFDQSIRGLNVGAQVDFRGVKIGKVAAIGTSLVDDIVRFPITIEIEPERVGLSVNPEQTAEQSKKVYQRMLDNGLRAKLDVGNLITGQLLVSMDIYPEEEKQDLVYYNNFPVIPTITSGVDAITSNINSLLGKLNALDFEKWNANISDILGDVSNISNSENGEIATVLNNLNETIAKANIMLDSFSEGSATRYDLDETLKSIKEAADAAKALTETINDQPNAIIFGKE